MFDPDDDDDVGDQKIYDLTNTKCESWESKDRTVATIRIADKTGLADMKIYLVLRAKLMQMEIDMGIWQEHLEEH